MPGNFTTMIVQKEVIRPLYPRLTNNSTVMIEKITYNVHWMNLNRTYEFESKETHTRVKTEAEVQQLLIDKRILIIDDGLSDAWKENPKK